MKSTFNEHCRQTFFDKSVCAWDYAKLSWYFVLGVQTVPSCFLSGKLENEEKRTKAWSSKIELRSTASLLPPLIRSRFFGYTHLPIAMCVCFSVFFHAWFTKTTQKCLIPNLIHNLFLISHTFLGYVIVLGYVTILGVCHAFGGMSQFSGYVIVLGYFTI